MGEKERKKETKSKVNAKMMLLRLTHWKREKARGIRERKGHKET